MQYPALTAYSRVITTKRADTCHTCGAPTVAGTDLAAVNAAGKWHAYCKACAASYAAQVAGLVKRCTEAEATADPTQVAKVTLPAEDAILAVLNGPVTGGTANEAAAYDVVLLLHQALSILSTKPVNVHVSPEDDARIAKGRTIAANPEASPRDRSFASSLVDQYDRKGYLSEKQWACLDRMSVSTTPVATVEPGLYLATDGRIFKAYITQNERLAVKRLIITETGA